MDKGRVRTVTQFILAVAGEEDDFRNRELGPIHLVKYLYLADLAYAEVHEGHGYLGVPWIFYHFGPWSVEVYQELSPALHAAGADEKRIQSRYADDFIRWHLHDRHLVERLESNLPAVVCGTIRRVVHTYGTDTSGLLHYVYRTPPMVHAAPGETLQLGIGGARQTQRQESRPAESLSRRQREKRKAERAALRSRVLQALSASRLSRRIRPSPAPRYDDVFLMGHPAEEEGLPFEEADVEFAEAIWKSGLRSDPDVP